MNCQESLLWSVSVEEEAYNEASSLPSNQTDSPWQRIQTAVIQLQNNTLILLNPPTFFFFARITLYINTQTKY